MKGKRLLVGHDLTKYSAAEYDLGYSEFRPFTYPSGSRFQNVHYLAGWIHASVDHQNDEHRKAVQAAARLNCSTV